MANLDRRKMMMLSGLGVMAAALPAPQAQALPTKPQAPRLPAPAAPQAAASYVFADEFDGPAGSSPNTSKWTIAKARETFKEPTYWEQPGRIGQYRDDRKNAFLDGKGNLVIRATKEGDTYYGAKMASVWEGGAGHTWEARIKFNCLTPGAWPAFWLGTLGEGELDIVEWYGNGKWPSATTVHAKSNGGEWETHNIAVDTAWHTWRTQWDANGARFWQDYTEGAKPYFEVSASQLPDWPFSQPGYTMFVVLNLAVAGSGGEDPSGGTYPADMLVDYVRVW
ncbi:glycoside hydrolase family 16 protein [Mycolicibacterium sp. 050232]|uniref:glycoside hydrolase family 16 protein n=1 Tax=Mycolicibacterium sp. 050232 TaxID=3113982 RepID=UPI002E299F24|nr:glycoside hydrolase family 16 protein [Mycolicibacterium sp. 050232]MED5813882.1 glycoside hydrolase family 16 protein [Mycolicibacterium sp. 050232]